ncbi:MAG TPA: preprotein translocase subunit SecG [Candidatus Brocadiaceae bacterium]|nr:preprotein translocase subunit SecG [Candidatus Brocadiaceae bacterium]
MVKAEKAFKWGIAIIVIFGILNAFFFLNLVIGLKIAVPILCVFLIGSILLQSGKGGGLAAIGGLGDQSAFGTRSSTFLSKVTYLIGAAFIVATIFLFKLSIPTKSLETMVTQDIPAAQHTHEHSAHEGEHAHGEVPRAAGASEDTANVGMQDVAEEESSKTGLEGTYHQSAIKEGASQSQPAGMNPVEEQASSVKEKSASEAQK